MVADRDMRPSGSIEAWICGDCGHRENVIASPEPTPPEQSRADLERWEEEGDLPGRTDAAGSSELCTAGRLRPGRRRQPNVGRLSR